MTIYNYKVYIYIINICTFMKITYIHLHNINTNIYIDIYITNVYMT